MVKKVRKSKKQEDIDVEDGEVVLDKKSRKKEKRAKKSKEEDNEEEEDEDNKKNVRAKITVESFTELSETIIQRLDSKIEKMSKSGESGIRFIRSIRKDVDKMRRQIPKISKTQRQPSTNKKNASGLVMKCELSDELCDFLKVDKGTLLSRTEINAAICVYVNLKDDETREKQIRWAYLNPKGKRDLQDPNNRRRIIPDKKLSKLLNYKQFQKDVKKGVIFIERKDKRTGIKTKIPVEDDGLYYYWIQKLFQRHIIRTVKVDKSL